MPNYSSKEKEYLKALGKTVRLLRKRAGFSQEGFAYEIGLDRTYIGGIERGERNISIINLKKISEGLRLSPVVFFKDLPKNIKLLE